MSRTTNQERFDPTQPLDEADLAHALGHLNPEVKRRGRICQWVNDHEGTIKQAADLIGVSTVSLIEYANRHGWPKVLWPLRGRGKLHQQTNTRPLPLPIPPRQLLAGGHSRGIKRALQIKTEAAAKARARKPQTAHTGACIWLCASEAGIVHCGKKPKPGRQYCPDHDEAAKPRPLWGHGGRRWAA